MRGVSDKELEEMILSVRRGHAAPRSVGRPKAAPRKGLLERMREFGEKNSKTVATVGIAAIIGSGILFPFAKRRIDRFRWKQEIAQMWNRADQMEAMYGWQLELPENSPLWTMTSGSQKDLKNLTADQLRCYHTFLEAVRLQTSIGMHLGFDIMPNANNDPKNHMENFREGYRIHWGYIYSAGGSTWDLKKLEEKEMFAKMCFSIEEEVLRGKTSLDRSKRAHKILKDLKMWSHLVLEEAKVKDGVGKKPPRMGGASLG